MECQGGRGKCQHVCNSISLSECHRLFHPSSTVVYHWLSPTSDCKPVAILKVICDLNWQHLGKLSQAPSHAHQIPAPLSGIFLIHFRLARLSFLSSLLLLATPLIVFLPFFHCCLLYLNLLYYCLSLFFNLCLCCLALHCHPHAAYEIFQFPQMTIIN